MHEFTEEEEARMGNTLTISGDFTFSQMHEWVGFLLPEVPHQYAPTAPATRPPAPALTR